MPSNDTSTPALTRIQERAAFLGGMERLGTRERNELALREAMLRLLSEKDGPPSSNDALAAEASLSRATMYRFSEAMADWREALTSVPADERTESTRLRAQIRELERSHAEERKGLLHTQSVLVQRVQALTLALMQARGETDVVSLLTRTK